MDVVEEATRNMDAPFYPIIYVGGYPMSSAETNEALADPYRGFKTGSRSYRASTSIQSPPRKFIFESPAQRLAYDFGYQEVFERGVNILDPNWMPSGSNNGIPSRSIVFHQYYDEGSSLLGAGATPEIEEYAQSLSRLVLRVRELVMVQEQIRPGDFKCYLVAHSIGGLVVRTFMQNRKLGDDQARMAIDKIFTYATPHNGIDLNGINMPSWLSLKEINTCNRERMAAVLDMQVIYKQFHRVDFMPERVFPISKVFCMVGTSRAYYDMAASLSRNFVGHGSDGVVKIENASLWGLSSKGKITQPAATAFAFRSHSGFFGLVNSEEAYQNLSRFLFGDLRMDLWLDVKSATLPQALAKHQPESSVNALYTFEVEGRARGQLGMLTRRLAEDDSPACRSYEQLTQRQATGGNLIYLSTSFLASRSRVNARDSTLTYAMSLGVPVPDYEVDRMQWADDHFEGAYLFRDDLFVSVTPPNAFGMEWTVVYAWQSKDGHQAKNWVGYKLLSPQIIEVRIPFGNATEPGIAGDVLLTISVWNQDEPLTVDTR